MKHENQDGISKSCIRNDEGKLATTKNHLKACTTITRTSKRHCVAVFGGIQILY